MSTVPLRSWCDAIEQHLQEFWNTEAIRCDFGGSRNSRALANFRVVRFAPNGNRVWWTYSTCGMSQPSDSSKLELHIFCPFESDEIVELLYAVADYHRTGRALGLNHVVNFGKPWVLGAQPSFGWISLPYLDGPDLELFESKLGIVRCLWLIPITASEREFVLAHGVDSLEALFESRDFQFWNPALSGLAER